MDGAGLWNIVFMIHFELHIPCSRTMRCLMRVDVWRSSVTSHLQHSPNKSKKEQLTLWLWYLFFLPYTLTKCSKLYKIYSRYYVFTSMAVHPLLLYNHHHVMQIYIHVYQLYPTTVMSNTSYISLTLCLMISVLNTVTTQKTLSVGFTSVISWQLFPIHALCKI